MYSGFLGKRRCVIGAKVDPAESRTLLANGSTDPEKDGIGSGQGRDPDDARAASDALSICALIGFMVFVCWCLTACGDLSKLTR